MNISIASDHGGYELKEKLKAHLINNGHLVVDYGTNAGEKADYPDMVKGVCDDVTLNNSRFGVLVCGTGIGISISANKVKGIRAALLSDGFSAKMAKEHNDANVVCFGGRVVGEELAYFMLDEYMNAEFGGDRHTARLEKIKRLEDC